MTMNNPLTACAWILIGTRRWAWAWACAWLACTLPQTAAAHAVLKDSIPAAAAALTTPPEALELTFNSRVETAMTRLSLTSADGSTWALPAQPSTAPGKVRADLPALVPGVYRVHWRVLASDGHVTEGQFHFTVVDAGARAP